jgi:hypothetical protein
MQRSFRHAGTGSFMKQEMGKKHSNNRQSRLLLCFLLVA